MNPYPEELERRWQGPTDGDRAEMLEAIGEDRRFHALTEEQKASVFRAMFDVRFCMDAYRREADGRKARTLERGPRTLEPALQHLVELRHSHSVIEVVLRMPNVPLAESNQFFDFAQAPLEACRLDVANTELVYDAPNANETWAQAQLQEAERLRSALAAVRIRSKELIGKMCRCTSGEAVRRGAIKKRFSTRH
jgi:hypothetical protein